MVRLASTSVNTKINAVLYLLDRGVPSSTPSDISGAFIVQIGSAMSYAPLSLELKGSLYSFAFCTMGNDTGARERARHSAKLPKRNLEVEGDAG
jgi:hypothetical protein